MELFFQSLVSGLAIGTVFAIMGLGFVIIYRVTHVVNFAQGMFAVLGALVMSSLVQRMPGLVAAPLAMLAVAVVAAALGLFVVAASNVHGVSALMITLGFSVASEGVFVLIWGEIPVSYAPVRDSAFRVLGVHILPQQVLIIVSVAVTLLLLQLFFSRSYLGKALTAAALNPKAAQTAGINTLGMGVLAFAVSGAISALAGLLLAPLVPVSAQTTHVSLAINGFAAAVMGGLFHPLGAVIGGLSLGQLESFVANYGDATYQEVVALVAMLVVLLVQSAGWRAWWRR